MFTKLSRWLKRLTDTSPPERSLPDKVRELLKQAELEAALQMLMDAGYTDAIALNLKREEALDQYERKLIDDEDFRIANSRITHASLRILRDDEAANSNMPAINELEDTSESLPVHFTEDQCQQIRTLLLQKDYATAIKLAGNWSQDGKLLYQGYHKTKRDLMIGLIRQEDHLRIIGQIIKEITVLASPDKARGPLTVEQQLQLRQLMKDEEWSALFALGGKWNEHFLLLSIQYNQVENSFSNGLMPKLSYEKYIGDIQQQVRKLLEE